MKERGAADLHAHSDRSDGTDAPARVAELASAAGLAAFALTDHDTTAGLEEAISTGRRLGIEVIPGVEISTSFEERETHLLGYFFRVDDAPLQRAFDRMLAARARRVEHMVELLNRHGIPITVAQVRAFAGGRSVGRPHVADALVAGGHVPSLDVAWKEYLTQGGKAWVDRDKLEFQEAVELIRSAGGVTSIAHPTMNLDMAALDRAASLGISAMETSHPMVGPADAEQLRDLCRRHGLIESGGSDCHGTRRGGPTLGTCRVPLTTVESLRRLARS